MNDDNTVRVFKALANPTRLKMVRELKSCRNTEESCSELSARTYLSQPTMSHHFSRLLEAGIIKESKAGTQKSYHLNRKVLESAGIDYKKI